MSRGRSVLRWILWLTVGALLLLRAGTLVTTGSGALVFGPAVFSAATVIWLFVTLAVVWRHLARTNEENAAAHGRRPERPTSGL